MISDEHIQDLNLTGKWLMERSKELISKNLSLKNKKKKRVSKKTDHEWKELYGRMQQFRRDMKKVLDEGEEWKDNT